MITLLEGKPGAGKSYEAVTFHIIPTLKSGRKVITNIPLNVEVIYKEFPHVKEENLLEIRLDAEKIDNKLYLPFAHESHYQDSWRQEKTNVGALYVIDEAQLCLPRRRGGAKSEVIEFYQFHRHHGIDILLMTQSYRQLDSEILGLIQTFFVLKKFTQLGTNKAYLRKTKDGERGAVTDTSKRFYKKSNFKYYKSHTASNSAVTEAATNDIKPLWQSSFAILPIVCFAYVIYSITQDDLDIFSKINAIAENQKKPELTQLSENKESVFTSNRVNYQTEKKQSLSNEVTTNDSSGNHPYSDLDLIIKSSYMINNEYNYFISTSNNDLEITTADLLAVGYEITLKASCLIKIKYADFETFLTCKSSKNKTSIL